jgi:hypothetical protein
LNGKLGLQSLNLPGQVPDLEQTVYVNGAAIVHVFPVHVRQARCREIDSRAAHHTVLDRDVAHVVILYVGRGFHLDETPSTVPATMEHIDAHENTAVLERTFEDRRNFPVRD